MLLRSDAKYKCSSLFPRNHCDFESDGTFRQFPQRWLSKYLLEKVNPSWTQMNFRCSNEQCVHTCRQWVLMSARRYRYVGRWLSLSVSCYLETTSERETDKFMLGTVFIYHPLKCVIAVINLGSNRTLFIMFLTFTTKIGPWRSCCSLSKVWDTGNFKIVEIFHDGKFSKRFQKVRGKLCFYFVVVHVQW